MQTTQHNNTRCLVYLHPAACSSRAAVEDFQHRTGLLVFTLPKGRTQAIQAFNPPVADDSHSPLGGDAA